MASVFTLDVSGTLLALLFGVVVFYFGLQMWWFFIAVLIDFLVLSSLATRAKEEEKMKIKGYEKVRSWKNVVANGLIPVAIVVLYFAYISYIGISIAHEQVVIYAFVASICAITADKFASEFGVLGAQPADIFTGKKVRKGTSGGITRFGTLMGFVASFLVGLTVFAIGASVFAFAVIVLSGLVGNLVDSLLGHFEEQKIGNKYTSNIMCAVSGALFCAAVLYFI
jgi:uncharacterized protein (TIGR00297 family)